LGQGFFAGFNGEFGKNEGGVRQRDDTFSFADGELLCSALGTFRLSPRWDLGMSLPSSLVPEEDQGYAFISSSFPDAALLQRTDASRGKLDEILAHTHGHSGIRRR